METGALAMLDKIRRFFSETIASELASREALHQQHGVQLATAALMMEMVRADFDASQDERALAADLLATHFQLSGQETDQLLALGDQEMQGASCLFEFTRLIDKELTGEQKIAVIEMLWRVAFQDGRLDKYEEYLMRKVAELIHVSHAALIQAKHRIEAEK